MIEVANLLKRHGTRIILDDISIQFEQGKVSCLLGPSGSGKSTLLRCVSGLETFDAGSIRIEKTIFEPGNRTARTAVGMVFQQFHLFSHMTSLENVMEAPVHVRKDDPKKARDRARELLERVGVLHRQSAYPRQLSGGEQQRVAIARALAMDPRALLLDEPTSALDPERKAGVIELLRKLAQEGTTMIVVTHDPSFANELADRAAVLMGGKILVEGDARTVLSSPDDPKVRAFLRLAQ